MGFVARLPELSLELERVLDRVTWQATPNVVVYGSAIAGEARVKAGPTARGFTTTGEEVIVPLWISGSAPYILIAPTDVSFGVNPEERLQSAPQQNRLTISTPDEEIVRTMSPAARAHRATRSTQSMSAQPQTILPCPDCGGGSGGGYETDGTRLPALYTPGYCFGWTSWGVSPLDASNDRDTDGIRDDCEAELAWAFRPMLARNNHDDAPEKEPYWSAARVVSTGTGVRIFYALGYYRDAGDHTTGYDQHDGDSEFIILELHNDMNPYDYTLWSLDQATLSAHWHSSIDATATYGPGELEYPEVYRGRPRIWASWDKHANYRSKEVCNTTWFDVCDTIFTGTTYDDLDVRTDASLGNSFNTSPANSAHRLMDCMTSRHPGSGRAGYGVECFWETSPPFAGWHPYNGQAASTAYGVLLSFYQF